jgi:hypothetical protein
LSSQAATEGGYGGAFGAVKSNEVCHVIDISVSVPVLGSDAGRDAVFGRQIVGALKTSDKSGLLSYAIARATIGQASNTLSVETNGLADSATKAIRQMAGGTLTAESAKNFGEGIGDCLSWVVENAKLTVDSARPALVFEPTSEYDENRSLCFGLCQIAVGNSLDVALKVLDSFQGRAASRVLFAKVESVIVAALYHRFRVEIRPTGNQKKLAATLLDGKGDVPGPNQSREGFYKAVLPYVRPDGSIVSLQHLAPSERIKARPWPPVDGENGLQQPTTKIGNEDLNFHTALDMGLGVLGDVHLSGDMRFCGFLSWSTYRCSGMPAMLVLDEYYGAGIRASIRYSGREIKGGATQVAAKVTLDGTATSFCIDILGVDVSALPSLGAFASGAATVFDSQTLSLIGGIWSEANNVITAHDKDAWRPCLTGVKLDLGATELQTIAGKCGAVAYALRQVCKKVPQQTALNSAVNADYRAAVVAAYAGVEMPGSEARAAAEAQLKLGTSVW